MRQPFRFVLSLALAILAGCDHSASRPAQPLPVTQPARPTTSPQIYREADDIRTTLTYIASDDLEGRGLMTQGVYKAADYIAKNFADAGLKPLPGLNGYFQDFPITLDKKVDPSTSLAINNSPLNSASDFSPLLFSSESKFTGQAVFVGYSVFDPDRHYDDYAGVDVKGKIVIAFDDEPPAQVTTNPSTHPTTNRRHSPYATFQAKAQLAADHGAIALLTINRFQDGGSFMTVPEGGHTIRTKIPAIQVSRAAIEKLIASAGNGDLRKLQNDIDSTTTPKSFPIANATINGNVALQIDRRTYHNVVGYLPGSGPHKDEYVVIGAHYDHLGRGEIGSLAFNSRQIHNGADDNGSGTCAVMEIARTISPTIAQAGKLDRSLIFVCFCGEERGLLGSQYFVEHPPVSIDNIVAMLNLDMVGRVRNDVIYDGGTGTAKDFDSFVQQADADSPLVIKTAGADVGGRGGIGPSDHMSFAQHSIPVLFFWSGMEPDYHRPTDKVDKINFTGIAEVVDFSRSIVAELAAMPREQYVSTYDHMHMGMGNMRVRLGIMPDYNSDDATPGVRVAAVMPDSSASKAGLREGDVIVGFDKDKVDSLGDYMNVLSKYKPGDVIDVIVMRNHQRTALKATLAAPSS